MKRPSHRSAALAALFVAVQLVAACGGNDDDNPAPAASPGSASAPPPAPTTISPLKALQYELQQPVGRSDFDGSGAVSDPTANGATLSLGAAGRIVLTVDSSGNGPVVTTPAYRVVSRFGGSLLMLCDDPAAAPGEGAARAVAVASRVAEGGVAATMVTDATALAGLRFFKMSHCAYQAGVSQGQNVAADGDTLSLAFDADGNASSSVLQRSYSAAEFSAMLAEGSAIDGMHFSAWRFSVDGQPRHALAERIEADPAAGVPALIQLWLPE